MKTIVNITGQPIALERDQFTFEETRIEAHEELQVTEEEAQLYTQIPNIVLVAEELADEPI